MNAYTNTSLARRNWFQRHPRRSWALMVISLSVVGVILFVALKPEKQQVTSDNPIIASYQKQLPSLAQKAHDNPQSSQASRDYAVALYATGDIQGAKEQYERLIKLSPQDATSRNNLGNVYRDLGDYDKAVASYQKTIELNPKNGNAYTNLANVYMYTLNRRDLGIKTYQDALQNVPDNEELQVLLGIAYEQSGDKANAKVSFEKVLATNPNNAAAAAGLKRVQ